jgi:hypothetical protein
LSRAERRIFGVDHAEISAMLLKKWAMPELVVEAVGAHLDSEVGGTSRVFAMDALFVAVRLSRMVIAEQDLEERQQRDQIMKEGGPSLGGQLRLVQDFEAGENLGVPSLDEFSENLVQRFGMGQESLYHSLYGLKEELETNQMFLEI